ncbi:glycosyltransferase [uncultured Solobacterium sp.]|uniref:glycosyltransferase n=1 Tax=uncultured Solobacterium sp. TaxID=747375 RepID=UPI0028F06BCC|nr:glycosyltransferase [uncultured Solobacterium sp.]
MENKEKNFASAVVYVRNAENRLEKFLKTIISTMEDNFAHSEVICVNDASDDKSLEIIKKTSEIAKSTSVSVINMSYFHGLELSMDAGIDMSIGDFVFEFDNTTLDFNPEMIMTIYYRSLKGYDIVSASPNRKEKFTSSLFYKVFDRFTDYSYKMTTESFRILSRRVINRVSSMNKTIPYRKVVYANCGLKTDTLKYEVVNNIAFDEDVREKKYRSNLAANSLLLFTDIGYRFAKFMTVFMMIVSVFMVLYSVVVYLTANPVVGWTTTILFLSVAFFGLFGILTIIIKYLQLLVDLVFKRKQYSFENIEKLTK